MEQTAASINTLSTMIELFLL